MNLCICGIYVSNVFGNVDGFTVREAVSAIFFFSLKTNNLSKRCVCTRGRGVLTDRAAMGRRTGRGRCWGRGDSSLQGRRYEQWLDILAEQAQLMAPQVVVQRLHVGEDALRV